MRSRVKRERERERATTRLHETSMTGGEEGRERQEGEGVFEDGRMDDQLSIGSCISCVYYLIIKRGSVSRTNERVE